MSARIQHEPTDEEILAIARSAIREGDTFLVKSSDGRRTYRTTAISCTCPHWQYRGTPCRHMQGVSLLCPPPQPYIGDAFAGY